MARLDGAGPLGTWRRIALPLSIPTTIAVAVLTFILYAVLEMIRTTRVEGAREAS